MDPCVLFVDDESQVTEALRASLRKAPYRTLTANSARAALEVLATTPVDVIVSDERMPEMAGTELLTIARERYPEVCRVVLTGEASVTSAIRAINGAAIFRYLTKPCPPEALRECLRDALLARDAARFAARAATEARSTEVLREVFDRALDSLWMAAQPVVSMAGRRVVAYEALVRTREPAIPHGGAFMAAAERLGRVRAIERRIRDAVAHIAPRLEGDAKLLVNLHPTSLNDPDLFAADAPLARHASRVVFEITERAALDEVESLEERVAALRARGYGIAVDDLGAGYAGLTSLARLRPEIVKIDMGLIRRVESSPRQSKLVAAIVQVCGELGADVVAEGIETVAECEHVVRLGCDLLQGYLFARPAAPFPAVAWPAASGEGAGPKERASCRAAG